MSPTAISQYNEASKALTNTFSTYLEKSSTVLNKNNPAKTDTFINSSEFSSVLDSLSNLSILSIGILYVKMNPK